MSVLFKALEKAARQNAEAHPSDRGGFAQTPGGTPLFRATPRRGRGAMRALAVLFLTTTAVVLVGLVVMKDDVERLLAEVLSPAPVYTPAPPPDPVPDPVADLPQEMPPPDAASVATVAAPTDPAESADDPSLAAESADAEPGRAEAPPAALVVDPADDIALLMQEGAARRASPVEPAVPPVAPPRVTVTAGPERLAVEEALAIRQGMADAAAASAPIRVASAPPPETSAAVTVSTLSRETQSTLAEAYTALVRGNYGEALTHYTALAKRDPANVEALAGRAAALHKLRRLAEAQEAYEKVLAKQPDNREAMTNLIALIGDAAPRDAIRRLEALQAQAPDFSPVPAQLGMLYARMGEVDRAEGALRRAISLSPGNALYHYNLAVVSDRAGRRGDAVQAYEQVLRLIGPEGAAGLAPQPIRDRLAYLRAGP